MECQLENINVDYEIYGDGHPLVSLHGLGPDHHLMTGCMEPIFEHRDGWKRIYPDLPGMGKTQSQEWIVNSDQMLEIILDFIDKVIPNQHFVLAGQSYGGYLARGIVHRKPELVDGLLLICPMIIAETAERTLPPHITLVKDPEVISSLAPKEREWFEAVAVVQSQKIWERTRDEVNVGVAVADMPFLSRLQEYGFSFSFDIDATPAVYEQPTLILVGHQDSIVGYRDAWKLIEKYPRGTFVVLDQAGHNLQIEQEGLFNSFVNEWLDRVEAQRV